MFLLGLAQGQNSSRMHFALNKTRKYEDTKANKNITI